MSKFSKVLVACAAMAAVAAPAAAIEADFTGFLQTRGVAFDNMDGDDDADVDDNARAIDQRFRLWTNAALNENVKAVFGIEIDNLWGQTGAGGLAESATLNKEVGAMGADAKGEIEVKHIYLDFNIPTVSTNIKAGTQAFTLGRGLIINDDAAGLLARYTPVQGQSVLFAWIKPREGATADDAADSDYYHLQYDATLNGWQLSPYVGYYDMAEEEGDRAWFLGVDVNGKLGPVGVAATLIGNDWDKDTTDGTGLAAWAKGTYKVDATTLSAEAAWYGDAENNGEFLSLSQGSITGALNNFSEIVTGGRTDPRNGNFIPAQTVTGPSVRTPTNPGNGGNKGGLSAQYYTNYTYLKLGAEQKLSDRSTVSAYYVYTQEAAKVSDPARRAAGLDSRISFGHEIDAYYDHAIVPGLTFTLLGAYLIADNDFGAGDDAWKLGTVLTYKF